MRTMGPSRPCSRRSRRATSCACRRRRFAAYHRSCCLSTRAQAQNLAGGAADARRRDGGPRRACGARRLRGVLCVQPHADCVRAHAPGARAVPSRAVTGMFARVWAPCSYSGVVTYVHKRLAPQRAGRRAGSRCLAGPAREGFARRGGLHARPGRHVICGVRKDAGRWAWAGVGRDGEGGSARVAWVVRRRRHEGPVPDGNQRADGRLRGSLRYY